MIAHFILYAVPFFITIYFCYLTAHVWERSPEARPGVVIMTCLFGAIILAWWWATLTVVGPIL